MARKRQTTLISAEDVSSRTQIKKEVALVVTNKPIPMADLIRQADIRRGELVKMCRLSEGSLKAAVATTSEPLSSPYSFAIASASEAPSLPSRKESLGGSSMFPKFVKPKRHMRRNSDETSEDTKIADLSSLVGMVAPKAHGGSSSRRNVKTANEIYGGLVSQNDVGGSKVGDSETDEAPKPSARALDLPSFAYYFEVTIVSGSAWIGLVPAKNVVTHEQAELMMNCSSSGDGSDYNRGLLSAATTQNPFPIVMHQIPGKSPESIGLGNNGELHIGGSIVGRDGTVVHSFTSHSGRQMLMDHNAKPWTAPFVANSNGNVLSTADERETMGCGWEIGGMRRVFFTRNGKVLNSDTPISGFDDRGNTLFPAVGMETEGTSLVANFGLDQTTPLRFPGDAHFVPITITRATEEESISEQSNASIDAVKPPFLSDSPSGMSNSTAAPVTTYFGDYRLKSVSLGHTDLRGVRSVTPGSEDSQLDAVLKRSMDETTLMDPDLEARPPMTQDGMEEARGIARELRNVAENPGMADPSLLKSLLELCRSKQQHVVSTLQQESVCEDLQLLIDLNDVLRYSIEAAEAAEAQTKKSSQPNQKATSDLSSHQTMRASFEHAYDDSKEKLPSIRGRVEENQQMPRSSPEVDELVEAKDFFSLLCLLRGHHNQRLASAYALMRFAKDEVIGGDEKTTSVRKEIQTSGGMHSLLTLFRASSNGQEIKMVAALAVSYLLPCYTDPDGFLSGNLGLKVIACLHYIVHSSDHDYVEGLNSFSMRESAALALTHIWLNLEPFLSQENRRDEDKKNKSTTRPVSIVSERVPMSLFRKGPFARAFTVRNVGERLRSLDPRKELACGQKLLEQTVGLIVAVAEKLLPSRRHKRRHYVTDTKSTCSIILAVESVCSVEPARSIAVREGLLGVLVQWLKSAESDLVAPAAKAMRFLVTLDDSYMAGWIHTQIVNEDARKYKEFHD